MSVCRERPATLPPLDAIGLEPVDHTHAMSRGGSGHHRPSTRSAIPPSRQPEASVGLGFTEFTPSALGKSGANNLFSMGNFATMGAGSKLSSEK
jgi:translation initiation factor 4G